MELTPDQINRISKLLLTASDQLYGPVWQGTILAPINNMGTSSLQPYDTPGGFLVSKTIDDPTTGFRLGFYKNNDTHELLVVPNGSDGWTLKDWGSNVLYTGWNQFERKANDIMDALRDAVTSDPATKIYIGGQSLGGALAQYVTVRLLEERQKPTVTALDPATQQMVEVANPLYNYDLNNVALMTYASPGVGDTLANFVPGFDLSDPAMQQIFVRHYTTNGEMVNGHKGSGLDS